MCGGGVRSILLLPLVARCLETINKYINYTNNMHLSESESSHLVSVS